MASPDEGQVLRNGWDHIQMPGKKNEGFIHFFKVVFCYFERKEPEVSLSEPPRQAKEDAGCEDVFDLFIGTLPGMNVSPILIFIFSIP
jgi:hypothetical protein